MRIDTDNITSCSFINKYGGKYGSFDSIALPRRIWFWCIEPNIFLSACRVVDVSNIEADRLSRSNNDDIEWALEKMIFDELLTKHPEIDIDLFASKLNAKLGKYVLRYPEEKSIANDAFLAHHHSYKDVRYATLVNTTSKSYSPNLRAQDILVSENIYLNWHCDALLTS